MNSFKVKNFLFAAEACNIKKFCKTPLGLNLIASCILSNFSRESTNLEEGFSKVKVAVKGQGNANQ